MNKRKHGRVRAQGVATHLHSDNKLSSGASVENLSMGGAFLRTTDPMPEKTPVVIDLVRPGLKKGIRVTGRVVSVIRTLPTASGRAIPGMGIAFDPYPEEVEKRLRELLLSIAPGPAVLEGDNAEGSVAPQASAPSEAPTEAGGSDAPVDVGAGNRLMVQVKGLLMELGDWQDRAIGLQKENAALRAELEKVKAELAALQAR